MPSFTAIGKPDFASTGHQWRDEGKVTHSPARRVFCARGDDGFGYTNRVTRPL
jgi:hypothetical protein